MPIGSFESAWEEYDHTDGPALREESKAKNKMAFADAPNWRLVIGSENFTRRLSACEVTFSREGESSMRFTVAANLRALQYERARVSFWIGYGTKLVPWFRGRLAEPIDYESGLRGEASAYGLFTQLGQRYFQGRVDYGGFDLRDAVDDLWERFGAEPDRLDFWGTHSTILSRKLGSFGYEISLVEALATILEPMQFQPCDTPLGMFRIKRGYLAELGNDEVFSGAGHYEPEDYPKEGFVLDQSMANFYDDVTIFRRNENWAGGGGPGVPELGPAPTNPDETETHDEYDVFVNRDTAEDSGVSDPGPFHVNEGRDYVVADYPGQQEHAERERELLVTSFSRGVGHFEWRCHPCDFELGDHLTVIRHEQIHDPDAHWDRANYYLPQIDAVSYACVVTDITFTLAAAGSPGEATGAERWAMTVSGFAFEIDRETIREPIGPTPIDILVPPDVPEDIDTPTDFIYVTDGDGLRLTDEDGNPVVVAP